MKMAINSKGCVVLPEDLRRRYGLEAGKELLVTATEMGITLFPLRPDIRKVYIEVTTRCNLACRTCVRNIWGEPLADMTDATFGRVLESMRELLNCKRSSSADMENLSFTLAFWITLLQ
jgi:bifunctional DNA-binding transcriptional regulator/antitoxin component of YhaV-PrlF toxin-antitoxin module